MAKKKAENGQSTPATEETKPEEPEVRATLMFLKDCKSSDGKRSQMWLCIDDIPNDGDELIDLVLEHGIALDSRREVYTKRKMPSASPGQIFSFKRSDTGIYPGTARFVGLWENQTDRIAWMAEHKTAVAEMEEEQAANKAAREEVDLELLTPLREAYSRLGDRRRQTYLLARFIQYITRGV